MSVVSVEVRSDRGDFWPGTAYVSIDGKVHAILRGGESFEVTIHDPMLSTTTRGPAPINAGDHT